MVSAKGGKRIWTANRSSDHSDRSRHLNEITLLIRVLIVFGILAGGRIERAEAKRPIVPSDCVTARFLLHNNSFVASIQISPDGSRVAYLVKAPNLATNQNDVELYVVPISGTAQEKPTLLLSSQEISGLHWERDSRHIVILKRERHHVSVAEVDIASAARKVLASAAVDITEYSIDTAEDTIVFATEVAQNEGIGVSTQEADEGYRIPFQDPARPFFKRRRLFLTKRRPNGTWSSPERIDVTSPLSHQKLDALQYQLNLTLSLSPNGRSLLLKYIDSGKYPQAWKNNPFVQSVLKAGFPGAPVLALYDMETRTTSMAMATPWTWSIPLWSSDGRSFLVNAQSPVGEVQCAETERDSNCNAAHLFMVQPGTGEIEEVATHVADSSESPLLWSPRGDVIVHTATGTIGTYSRRDGIWIQTHTVQIPLNDPYRYGQLATDGRRLIGDYQNATTPPEIFEYNDGDSNATILAQLDPQFDALEIAPMRRISWTTATGYEIHGFLFTPPDYVPGHAYPLVIQTKPDAGSFVCDSGENHDPSFAPQPIADAGMMYLIRTYPEDYSQAEEQRHYPRGYPGGIGEAAFQMDVWDSAVNTLAAQGLVDPERVGIIGFSRTGWYTEFILAQSKIPYKAATISDNVQYSMGEYWLLHTEGVIRGYDAMYDGPPYGESFKNWLQYSVSFNLDKVHTPILMEVMGQGNPYDRLHELPDNLALSFEVFSGLSKLGRTVELYFYPNEVHQPDHPRARFMSLERNFDWYRHWLQGSPRSQHDIVP
jgi:dipeptidyl aminopeptidase/acylaminoacyl peptidase